MSVRPLPVPKRLYLDQEGLEMFLGRTECAVMRAVWQGYRLLNRIHPYVCEEYKPVAFTTVSTTAARLVEKGYLFREPVIDAPHKENLYHPTVDTEEHLTLILVHKVLYKVSLEYPNYYSASTAMIEIDRVAQQEHRTL